MRDVFKGFLRLRLIGFLPLPLVLALVLGIRALARGSDLLGVGLIAGVLVLTAAIASILLRRARTRRPACDGKAPVRPG